AIVAVPVLSRVQVNRAAAEALQPAPGQAGAAPTGPAAPDSRIAQWFIDLVPPNVVRAMNDDAMLPVIVFSVLFALALARVRDDRRIAVLHVVDGIADAMQKLVAAILELAPIGVFALAVPLAARLGYSMAGAVAVYVVLVVGLTALASLLLLYPLGIVGGRMSPIAFASYCAPAQAVAFSSRSSLAALPAALEAVERAQAPPVIAGFLVPL